MQVMSCLHNEVESHMMGGSGDGCEREDCHEADCGHNHSAHTDTSGESLSPACGETCAAQDIPNLMSTFGFLPSAFSFTFYTIITPLNTEAWYCIVSSLSVQADDGEGDAAEENESAEEQESDEESGDGAADLVFPASYSFAIAQLLATAKPAGEGIPVSDIKLPAMEEKLGLAFALWSEGVIYTVLEAKPA